jgi:hypothetical protein
LTPCRGADLVPPADLRERARGTFRLLACLAEGSVRAHGGRLLQADALALGLVAEALVEATRAVRSGHPGAGELVDAARDMAREGFWLELHPPLLPELLRA